MKNKNGWGFSSYIIGSSVLLIALLIATFLIIRLYRKFAGPKTQTPYQRAPEFGRQRPDLFQRHIMESIIKKY